MRDIVFACVLAVSAVMVSVGIGYYTFGAGLAVGGVLLAFMAVIVLADGGGT